MAKSGFVPAWMKIQSSDKTNGSAKITLDRNNYQSQTSNRSETSSTSSSPPTSTGPNRNGFDGHSESFFTFSPSRRSYSRERAPNSFAKHIESSSNGHDNYNGYRSINTSQRRLHSISSYSNDRPLSNIRHNSVNGDREKIFGTNDHEQTMDPSGFDRLEQDFPSLNGRDKHDSSSNERSSSVWNNAASKFRTSHNEPFKLFDRSMSNNIRTVGSNRILTRKDRLLSTPNGVNGSSTPPRSITLELQTNCITQTKNLDKRSDFFNSLKYGENKNGVKRQYNPAIKPTTLTSSDKNVKASNATLLILSVVETPEEKELLIRMGWNEYDELNYEITDKDKEEYENQMKLLHKTNQTSATLISALYRRVLPCIDIRDLLRFEMSDSHSDDEDDDD